MTTEFLIGMRWAHLWKLAAHPWVPLAFARMLRSDDPDLQRSFITVRPAGPVIAQRWSNAEALDRWAKDASEPHALAWGRFAREHGAVAGWGIWHETRVV